MNPSTKPTASIVGVICALAFAFTTSQGHAQTENETPFLWIGDQAPDLEIEHWFSDNQGTFEHTTKLVAGRIYVIEFWATWCRPCLDEMPKIAELQQQLLNDNVQFISITAENRETIERFLERRVSSERQRTYRELTQTYCLTSDPDKSVKQDYFRAAKQFGIPCTFIVGKSGLIEWIGPTDQLEEPLRKVIADAWDRNEFIVVLNRKSEARKKAAEIKRRMSHSVSEFQSSLRRNEPEKAVALVDQMLNDDEFKHRYKTFRWMRLQVMLQFDLDDADIALQEFTEENADPQRLNTIAWEIFLRHESGEQLNPKLLAQAKRTAGYAVRLAPEHGGILDTLAHLVYVVDGDVDQALKIQTKALKYAGTQQDGLKPFFDQLKTEQDKRRARAKQVP